MADFLTAVSTTRSKIQVVEEVSQEEGGSESNAPITFETPEQVAEALKNQPNLKTLEKILEALASEITEKNDLNLSTPGPVQATIGWTLVSTTIPDYWRSIKQNNKLGSSLAKSLQNTNGIGAIIARLDPLISDPGSQKQKQDQIQNQRDPTPYIEDLLDVLERILESDGVSTAIWNNIQTHAGNPIQLKLMWREYLAQIASGRLLSRVAQAEDVLKARKSKRQATWLADGNAYGLWLGRNIANMMLKVQDEESNDEKEASKAAVTEFCAKSLGLGYLGKYHSNHGRPHVLTS